METLPCLVLSVHLARVTIHPRADEPLDLERYRPLARVFHLLLDGFGDLAVALLDLLGSHPQRPADRVHLAILILFDAVRPHRVRFKIEPLAILALAHLGGRGAKCSPVQVVLGGGGMEIGFTNLLGHRIRRTVIEREPGVRRFHPILRLQAEPPRALRRHPGRNPRGQRPQ